MEAMISDETYIGVDKESNDGRKCGEFHDDKIEFSNNIKNLRNDVISNWWFKHRIFLWADDDCEKMILEKTRRKMFV